MFFLIKLGTSSCVSTQIGRAGSPESEGDVTVYDGGGPGKGGKVTLSVDGKTVAEGRVEKTQPLVFSADETADVGLDNQTPVAEDIGIGRDETRFSGEIHKIILAVKDVK